MTRNRLPPPAPDTPSPDPQDGVALPMLTAQGDIPDDVWHLLQQAGHKAASRLYDLLHSEEWTRLSATARIRLIDIALTRAYGLPVKRSIDVSLSTNDADAVAASLDALRSALPESQARTRARPDTLDAEVAP